MDADGAAAGPVLLELRGVRAGYGETDVLHDIGLAVPEGQLLCVLGPSGSGKSTLLRVIAGLERPSAGRVSLAGHDLAGVPPHERGIGLMFQDYALFPHRDVAGNVGFGLRMRGLERRAVEVRVAELLELVGLSGMGRRSVTQLSGGEQQRVALARALAPRPRLLMLDEPMGSLDRSLRERLPEELRAIFERLGLTVLYVTHDQDEALSVADRVVILTEGAIAADGPPEALWTRPPSAWVAGFLGFRNVTPARPLPDGALETPWGRLSADRAPRVSGMAADGVSGLSADGSSVTLVLRPDRLGPSPGGPIRGHVVSRRFAGDHVVLGVRTAEGSVLHVESRWTPLPTVGDELELDVEPGGIHLIPGPGALPFSRMSTADAPALPAVGQPAPSIRLPDDTGAIRDLADERGHWMVLFFYPKDDTPGCTVEACQFRDALPELAKLGATVWGISRLDSASKAAFKAKHGLGFPLLADEDHEVAARYGVWVEKQQYGRSSMGIARTTVLVDPEGRVARVWDSVKPDGHAAEVMEALRAEQAERAT